MASSAALFGPSFACTNSDVSQRIFFAKLPPNNVHTDIFSSTSPSQAFLSVSNGLTTKGAAYKFAPILALNKVFSGLTTKATAADAPAATESALVDVPPLLPQQKIRIKLRSYWTPRIQEAVRMILEAAKNTDAKIMGPVPLPTKRRLYCVLTSPHVDKDAREHFEIRTHRRLIDILNPTPRTIDALMQLDIPAGVDIEVKL